MMGIENIKFKDFAIMQGEPVGKQAVLGFGEYELSIVSHPGSYGGKKGLYEIGVFKGKNMVEMPGITEPGDTVKGFLTESDVDVIIKKMTMATGSDPVDIG